MNKMTNAINEYLNRRNGLSHPDGQMVTGIWRPSEFEWCDCCDKIKIKNDNPAGNMPYGLYTHCNTMKHVANLFQVDVGEFRQALRERTGRKGNSDRPDLRPKPNRTELPNHYVPLHSLNEPEPKPVQPEPVKVVEPVSPPEPVMRAVADVVQIRKPIEQPQPEPVDEPDIDALQYAIRFLNDALSQRGMSMKYIVAEKADGSVAMLNEKTIG